jgi:hypothetical protein
MSQNPQFPTGNQPPYEPPSPLQYATPQSGPNLKKIATQQRAIMFCILAEILIIVLQIILGTALAPAPGAKNPFLPFLMLLSFAYLAVVVAGAVFIFMLAISLYNTGVGILLGILVLVPLVGLIVLLIVNGKATKLLREHGVKVGLMGADPSTIPTFSGP